MKFGRNQIIACAATVSFLLAGSVVCADKADAAVSVDNRISYSDERYFNFPHDGAILNVKPGEALVFDPQVETGRPVSKYEWYFGDTLISTDSVLDYLPLNSGYIDLVVTDTKGDAEGSRVYVAVGNTYLVDVDGPIEASARYNQELVLSVPEEGLEDATYQWYSFKDDMLTKIYGETGSTYVFNITYRSTYVCLVTVGDDSQWVVFDCSVDSPVEISFPKNE